MKRLETFSYLPTFSEEETAAQVRHIVERGLVVAIEHTEAPDPRSPYWTLWKLPLFDVRDPELVLADLDACRREHPDSYVKVVGYDAGQQGQVVSFVVHRPGEDDA
jgi:ribulose-bisphosphate carboxylase small chain